MKNIKRILCLLLVFALFASVLASCGNKPDKNKALFATYNKNEYVYEEDTDYRDFLGYNTYVYLSSKGYSPMTAEEYAGLVEDSVNATILYRTLEKELGNRGLKIDEDAVNLAVIEEAKRFEQGYAGGYAKFREEWNLSENALTMLKRYDAMLDLVAKNFVDIVPVSEEEAYEYYLANASAYYVAPHYSLYSLVLQVTDTADEALKAEVRADAEAYIARLRNGESWEDVKNAAFIKYNVENGMMYSYFLSGKENVSLLDFKKVTDLDARLAEIDAEFEEAQGVPFSEMFPDGFDAYAAEKGLKKDTADYKKAFEIFYNYSASVYIAEYTYIISTAWEDGATYEKPLYHEGFACYVVITFDTIEESGDYTPFAEVKDEIMEKLENGVLEIAIGEYLGDILDGLGVEYFFSIVSS